MKKTVSINLGGIVFHIEEDGYEKLRAYLEDINAYFASFEDAQEIIQDIEYRIAELFLRDMQEGKQVIATEQVEQAMASLGSVRDFQAEEQEEEAFEEQGSSERVKREGPFRDLRHRIIAGVSSGLGHYFGLDPLVIRLLWVIITLGLFIFAGYGVIAPIAYVVLWIAMPGRKDLPKANPDQQLFRDGEKRVLGGVAAGLGAYLGVSVLLLRVLFALSILLGGGGVVLYILMWIFVPRARSYSDRVKMHGQKVTLDSIERTVKRGIGREDEKEESTLTKVLLFPFRLVGQALQWLGSRWPSLGTLLVGILRYGTGGILVLIALLGFTFSTLIFLTTQHLVPQAWSIDIIPSLEYLWVVSGALSWVVFAAGLCVHSFLMLIGLTLFRGSRVVPFQVFALLILGIVAFGTVGAVLGIRQFTLHREDAEVVSKQTLEMPTEGTLSLARAEDSEYVDARQVDLQLLGHPGNTVVLRTETSSLGKTKAEARDFARQAVYNVAWKQDSILTLPYSYELATAQSFRLQQVEATLFVPIGQEFLLHYTLAQDLSYNLAQKAEAHAEEWMRLVFTGSRRVSCLSCADDLEASTSRALQPQNSRSQLVELSPFSSLFLDGGMEIEYRPGDRYTLEIEGPEYLTKHLQYRVHGDQLLLDYNIDKVNLGDVRDALGDKDLGQLVKLRLRAPYLKKLEADGLTTAEFRGLKGADLDIRLEGKHEWQVFADVEHLQARVAGISSLTVKGSARTVDLAVHDTSSLDAYQLRAETGQVEAHDLALAKVWVSGQLEQHSEDMARIQTR